MPQLSFCLTTGKATLNKPLRRRRSSLFVPVVPRLDQGGAA